jgi:hypothetical protein
VKATPIELYVQLDLPPVTVRDATMKIMRAIAQHEVPYQELTLSVDLNMPGHSHVAVPIEAEIVDRPDRWECRIRIAAAANEKIFPTFDGTLSVTPDGGRQSELWLQGSYVPPGGAVGKGLDATLFHGVAERSLREFLSWLAEEVREDVARTERDYLEQVRRFRG